MRDPPRRRQDRRGRRCCAGSIPPTRSSTTATAASCTTCCGRWPAPPEPTARSRAPRPGGVEGRRPCASFRADCAPGRTRTCRTCRSASTCARSASPRACGRRSRSRPSSRSTNGPASPALGEAALGALLTCLCDAGRPDPAPAAGAARLRRCSARRSPPGSACCARCGLPVVVPLAGLRCIFCTSFARVWGQAAMQVGNLLTVVTVLALDRAEPAARGADARRHVLRRQPVGAGC